MFRIFSQPYPLNPSTRHHLKTALYISLFVMLFLMLFKPFGLSEYSGLAWNLRIAGYGALTFVTLLIVFFLVRMLKPLSNEENWTTGREVLSQLVYIVFVGIANLLYTHYVFG